MLQNQQHSSRSLQDPTPPQCKPRANHRSNPKAKQIAVISAGITVTIPNQSKQSFFCFFNALTEMAYLFWLVDCLFLSLSLPDSVLGCWEQAFAARPHMPSLASVVPADLKPAYAGKCESQMILECSRHVQTFCWKCIVPHGFTPCYTSNQKFHSCSTRHVQPSNSSRTMLWISNLRLKPANLQGTS